MTETPAPPPKPAGWLSFAIDFGPLLIFFLTFKFGQNGEGPIAITAAAIKATGIFMVAILVALAVSQWKLKRISPMLWLSAILVLGFGALTIYFHDEKFIQIKPTLIYLLLGGLLIGGLFFNKPLLKYVLEHGYDGLSERGWTVLTRNWALYFMGLALTNEIVRRQFDFDTWLNFKVWGVTIISFLFAAANLPMLMKHGLGADLEEDQS
jgi:intracellular septation protein